MVSTALRALPPPSATAASVDIVVPVHNEATGLESSVRRLRAYLDHTFPFAATITIADNASTDGTSALSRRLAGELTGVRCLSLRHKGRGRALRLAWSASDADVVAYMDVDLSTDLDALLPLVAPLVSGHSDVAIGTRLAHGSRVTRGTKREVISRLYNLVVRATLQNRFSDAQCGFKALRRDVADALLPLVRDHEWFFDTELLVLAERNGFRIHEVPVDWTDDPRSSVAIARTALADLRGIGRLVVELATGGGRVDPPPARRPLSGGELARFAGVGLASTLVYLLLFAVLGTALDPYAANALALVVCTAANLAGHRRVTFGRGRPVRRLARVAAAAVGFAVSLAATSLALWSVCSLAGASLAAQLLGVTLGTAVAAVARLAMLRAWLSRRRRGPDFAVAVPASSGSRS
jgi:putative flippase GtrA